MDASMRLFENSLEAGSSELLESCEPQETNSNNTTFLYTVNPSFLILIQAVAGPC